MSSQSIQSNRIPSIVLRVGLFVLVSFVLLIAALPAQAQTSREAKWIFNVYFDSNAAESIVASRTIQIWQGDIMIDEWTTDMSSTCTINGGVTIVGDRALFDGTGHIDCNLPSFRQEVLAETGYFLPPQTLMTGEVWSWARVENVDFSAAPNQPLFYIPAYELLHQLEYFGSGQITTELHADTNQFGSNPFVLPAGNQRIGSRIIECDSIDCDVNHKLNNKSLGSSGSASFSSYWATTDAATITIGSNGISNFTGTMTRGRIDPPVRVIIG